jgi:hypothetical protein
MPSDPWLGLSEKLIGTVYSPHHAPNRFCGPDRWHGGPENFICTGEQKHVRIGIFVDPGPTSGHR